MSNILKKLSNIVPRNRVKNRLVVTEHEDGIELNGSLSSEGQVRLMAELADGVIDDALESIWEQYKKDRSN